MVNPKQLTQETYDDDKYEEEWKVVMNTKGEYTLSKLQAQVVMQSIAQGKREVMFESFMIAIPYIAEFYREKRYLKGMKQLPERATEPLYQPISPERWKEIKKQAYAKIGKNFKEDDRPTER